MISGEFSPRMIRAISDFFVLVWFGTFDLVQNINQQGYLVVHIGVGRVRLKPDG
jgi:hypothetical protein